jgi:2-methylisocitrate lyase-like PEP mutase family enzyme
MPSPAEKRATFRKLHAQGCFVIPNPWDVGSARYLQGLGFKALASTSAGFAFTQGLADGAVPRTMMLAHFREIAAATDVPLNADFEGGFADAPEGVAESIKLCVETGVAGLSIEDSTSDPAVPLYDFELALARVRAARAAIDAAGGEVVFTARSEASSVAGLISRRLCAASRHSRQPAPIASTRPASKRATRSRRWSKRWRRNR